MFKSVEYDHFESNPDLKRLIQEKAMPIVEDELRDSAGRISLRWKLGLGPSGEQIVVFELDDEWAGKDMGIFPLARLEFEPPADRFFRWRIRDIHGRRLDDFLRKQVERIRQDLAGVNGG